MAERKSPVTSATALAPIDYDTMSAEERELARARSRGVADQDIDRWRQNVLWVLSARTDDRVALFEPDPRHPGGQAFVAGAQPDFVYRTPQVQQLIMQGLLIEVPEPSRTVQITDGSGGFQSVQNRRYPIDAGIEGGLVFAAQPGRPIPLGRRPDPELFDAESIALVERRLAGRPNELDVKGGYVPSKADVDRPG